MGEVTLWKNSVQARRFRRKRGDRQTWLPLWDAADAVLVSG